MRKHITTSREPRSPGNAALELIVDAAGELAPDKTHLQEWFRTYSVNHSSRLAFDLEMVLSRAHSPDARILECGSIPLLLTRALSKQGLSVVGLDIEPERFSRSISALDLDVSKLDIERQELPFGDHDFDLVIFNEIFEHLRVDPIFTMTEVHRVLRPGGTLLLSTPNLRSLNGLWNLLIRNRCFSCSAELFNEYEKLRTLGHMGHVREYTSREIVEFLQKIGFQPVELIYRGAFNNRIASAISWLVAQLRPFMSVVALKP